MNELFFELIRVALGNADGLSHIPKPKEWQQLYDMAKKQSLVGICFAGVQKLVDSEKEDYCGMNEMQYLTWMGMAAKIQQRNEVVNRQCVELQEKLAKDGFRSYIMKGQSNAALYGDLQMLRQSGDIDVYLEGGLNKILAYARTFGDVKKVNELEITVPVFSGTEVEFHYRPFIMRNPFRNVKLQALFKSCEEANLNNRISLSNCTICAPTVEFNLVHQLVHIYHHFITEGVGLRQLKDYYFVIQASNADDVRECQKMVASLGLNRFASALMWVIAHVFANENHNENENFYPWQPNEKNGRLLLDEILMSGNFGHTDERAKDIQTSRWKAF